VLFLLVEGNYIDTRANIKLYGIPNVKNVLAKPICYVTRAVISSLAPFSEGTYVSVCSCPWTHHEGIYGEQLQLFSILNLALGGDEC
jgi:hypothetical protein